MKANTLQLAETADLAAWDAWVEQSPQGTVFCKSTFLQSLNARFRLFTVVTNTQVIALLPLLEDDAGQVVRYPFTPYQGILFCQGHRLRCIVAWLMNSASPNFSLSN